MNKQSEQGQAVLEVAVVVVLVAIIVFGMHTVANVGGHDIFTSFWAWFATLGA